MIGVIADDLSGAAEIAGLAFRYGLEPVICLQPTSQDPKINVVVWDTDSRSCSAEAASLRVSEAANDLQKNEPDWIFKKVDSVFRGNIAIELENLGRFLKFNRTILIPANPSLGRTIRKGRYYIYDHLLEETDFAGDPELAARTSDVVKLLGPLHLKKAISATVDDAITEGKIVIGDANTTEDLICWAEKLSKNTLPAGGSDFMAAILEMKGFQSRKRTLLKKMPLKTLLISGTASRAGRERVKQAESEGIPVCRMPEELLLPNDDFRGFINRWQNQITEALQEHTQVIVTTGMPRSKDPLAPSKIGNHIFELTRCLLRHERIEHLWIEGGATASRIIRGHNWKSLKVVHEWSRGVVSLRSDEIDETLLTLKPGSYPWPKEIWNMEMDTIHE